MRKERKEPRGGKDDEDEKRENGQRVGLQEDVRKGERIEKKR